MSREDDERTLRTVREFARLARVSVEVITDAASLKTYVLMLRQAITALLHDVAIHPCAACNRSHSDSLSMTFEAVIMPIVMTALDGLTPEGLRKEVLDSIDCYVKAVEDAYAQRQTMTNVNAEQLAEALRALAPPGSEVRVAVMSADEFMRMVESSIQSEDDDGEAKAHIH